MARRFVSRPRVVRSQRSNIWFDFNLGEFALAASSLTLLGSLSAATLLLALFTIIRSRLLITYSSDQEVADETPFGAFGMIVVNAKAAALGITGVPTPVTNSNDDFYVWQAVARNYQFVSATGSPGPVEHQYTIDSKAMRKVDAGDDVAAVFEQQATVGAVLTVQGRALVKMH